MREAIPCAREAVVLRHRGASLPVIGARAAAARMVA
jgi:hypothetical protein